MKGVIKIIGCEGQYLFKFSIGNKDDFINQDDLDYFTLIEEAGNVLPTWEISFRTEDKDILKVWNEGNDFKVTYSVSQDDKKIDTKLLITKNLVSKVGDQKFQIIAVGIYAAIDYITVPHVLITAKKSGVEAISDVVSGTFKFDSNISKSEDSQNWIQPNTTNKRFVDELWLHSYLTGSFIGTGITSDGRFVLKDIKQSIANEDIFKFTNKPELPTDINYVGDHNIESNSGFINCWVGYGKEKPVYNIENDTYTKYLETIDTLMVLNKKFSRNSSVTKRSALIGVENVNTHSNYWKSALRNIQGLSLFSSNKLTLSYYNLLNTLKVLDVAMFNDESLDEKEESEEYQSGLYIVGLVSRSVGAKQFCTTAQLFREGTNTTTGNLR